MLPPGSLMLLLSILLLGAGSLSAGVHSAPVEKDGHVEEMVTRCIVEVLLNVLSKADAPPINPLCKEFLKQNNRQKEEDQDRVRDLETNTMEKPQEHPVKEEQGPNEEEFKRQAEVGEKWHPEEKQHGGNDDAEGDSYSLDEAHKGEIEEEDDKRTEEDASYKRNFPSEGESQTKQHSEDLERELQDKNILPPPGKVTEDDYKRSGGQQEEIVHSQERKNEDSKEEEDAEEEEEEEESREKYHHSFHREYEDSSEREDVDTDKRGHKPSYYYRKPRLGSSSEYKRRYHDEKKDSPEESSEEEHEFWDKRSHYPKHYYEARHHSEEKRNSVEMHGSEEMGGKSRNKEHPDKWQPSREDSEEEDMGHHSWGNEEKQRDLERKRLREELQKELRHQYEERTPHSKPSEEDVAKEHSRDEKRHQHDKERLQLQLEELPKLQNMEKEDREQRFHIPEEGEKEEKRHYPSVLEEELEKRHHNERGKHVANKRTLLLEEGYPRSHYLVENVKRAVAPYIPYYQQLRWKNRHAEKKADIGNPFLESEEEEPRSQMNERDFFPEYNDYDLWEKKQLMDDLGHKHSENNNLEMSHKFEVKRQYNKMDQLAHLLSNRKKSVEFPELYSSREDMKRGHIIRSGEGKLRQRPLTQEEEKELENLAAMDLELQKIAEKFNSNRRG